MKLRNQSAVFLFGNLFGNSGFLDGTFSPDTIKIIKGDGTTATGAGSWAYLGITGWFKYTATSGEMNVLGEVAIHLEDTDIAGGRASTSDEIVAFDPADLGKTVWDYVLEGSLSAAAFMRILLAMTANGATGIGLATTHFKSLDGLKDRIVGTIASGVRTITGLDGTP